MYKRKLSDNDALWFGMWQLGTINIEQQSYERQLEGIVLDIQRQHGLQSGPPNFYPGGRPSLTQAMTRLIEGFKLALFCDLADIPPRRLPSDPLPVLVDQVPEEHFAPVLAALRAAAQRLHEEDASEAMMEVRRDAELRGRAGQG